MTPFARDRFTWLAYLMLAFYSYTQATLGPLMPSLRAQLHLDYSVAALHLSAFALGIILTGLIGDRAVERWGRRAMLWLGGAGMALGGLLLTLAGQAALTIGSAFLMGFVGANIVVIVPAALADRHGNRRAIPLTESNVVASIAATIAPLVIGFGEQTGFGWRIALVVGAAGWLVLLLAFRQTPIPAGQPALKRQAQRPLPRRFWVYWLVVLLAVSLEWCMSFWGADFLQNSVGLESVLAATLMSVFFVAMVIGRFVGSRLTHTLESSRLLIYAVALVGVGFPLFWLARLPALNIVGLFITGLGIANLFPLTLAVATSIDPEQSNTASARVSLAAGIAIFAAPQMLASFADRVGIYNAFAVAALLVIAAAILVTAGRRVGTPVPVEAQG